MTRVPSSLLGFLSAFAISASAQNAVTILWVNPPNASYASQTTSVVVAFSEPMSTNRTSLTFFTVGFQTFPVRRSWNHELTVLTNQPLAAFPGGLAAEWTAGGQSKTGTLLQNPPPPVGVFTLPRISPLSRQSAQTFSSRRRGLSLM